MQTFDRLRRIARRERELEHFVLADHFKEEKRRLAQLGGAHPPGDNAISEGTRAVLAAFVAVDLASEALEARGIDA